jgi:hypothetical protein
MKKMKQLFYLIILFSIAINAQEKKPEKGLACNITQNNLLLDGKSFASAPPIFLRVFNEDKEYAVVQLGKRKSQIYLYFKVFSTNVCVKQKQPLELNFEGGEIYPLKNKYFINCEGIAIAKLSKKDVKKIKANRIAKVKLFSLEKDYEFSPSNIDNSNIREYLNCLKYYKVKKKLKK